jgi:hypothetical protein
LFKLFAACSKRHLARMLHPSIAIYVGQVWLDERRGRAVRSKSVDETTRRLQG